MVHTYGALDAEEDGGQVRQILKLNLSTFQPVQPQFRRITSRVVGCTVAVALGNSHMKLFRSTPQTYVLGH